jgi:hypothetical protein
MAHDPLPPIRDPVPLMLLALRCDVVTRALRYAGVVGVVLVTINHGPALLAGDVSPGRVFQIALTFCVPYAVTTFASVQAVRGEAARGSGVGEPDP